MKRKKMTAGTTTSFKSTDIPPQACPHCGYLLDASTDAYGDETPRAGDASMCAACGKMSIFTNGMGMRLPTPDEQMQLDASPEVIKLQIIWTSLPHPKAPRKRRRLS